MSQSQLIILHHVEAGAETPDTLRVSFDQFKGWIRTGKIMTRFFRYKKVVCRTYRLEVIPKPFLLSLLLRLLSRGDCAWLDAEGKSRTVGFGYLAGLFKGLLAAWFQKKDLLHRIQQKTEELSRACEKAFPLDLKNQPLYLRSDLSFGLRSGGSVGHIAGVLNHLGGFTGDPIFFTSDMIPTVRPELETHVVFPTGHFSDFKELPSLDYNQTFTAETLRGLGGRKISFVYQRYGLNNYSGVELSQKLNVPLVLEYNGSEIWVGRHWDKPLKYEKYSEAIELLCLQKAVVVTVVSRPLKDELVNRGILPEKILVNPNGVDPEIYSSQLKGDEIRRKWGLDGMTVIGFIGTFGRWHGAEVLAEGFGALLQENPEFRDRVRLLMIGDGFTMPQVKEILGKRDLLDFCVLTGTVSQSEGPAYLAACDILASPTLPNPDGTPFFGSPTKLFEYMAMGKGIVASDLDQIGEVLKHDETGWLVKPGDAAALAEGLKKLVEDPSRRNRLGEAARKEAIAKYTWKEHTRRIIEKLKQGCL